MNKRKLILSVVASLGLVIGLTGCDGGGDSGTTSSTTTSVTASDAYVVALKTPAKLILSDGTVYTTTTVNADGKVTFDIPAGTNLLGATVKIPDDAIVDADGDGKLSDNDQIIRTALLTKFIDENGQIPTDIVANPTTTAVLLKDPDVKDPNNLNILKTAVKTDPVKLKEEAIQKVISGTLSGEDINVDDLVSLKQAAYNDGIAYTYKIAKNISEKLKNSNVDMNPETIANDVVNNIDVTGLLAEIDNETVSYETFVTDLKNQIETSVTDFKNSVLANTTQLTEEKKAEIEQEINNELEMVSKKLEAEKELLAKIKTQLGLELQNNLNLSQEEKERMENDLKEKFSKLMVIISDTDIDPDEVITDLDKTDSITNFDLNTVLEKCPKNSEVLAEVEKYKEELENMENNKETTENISENLTPPSFPSIPSIEQDTNIDTNSNMDKEESISSDANTDTSVSTETSTESSMTTDTNTDTDTGTDNSTQSQLPAF